MKLLKWGSSFEFCGPWLLAFIMIFPGIACIWITSSTPSVRDTVELVQSSSSSLLTGSLHNYVWRHSRCNGSIYGLSGGIIRNRFILRNQRLSHCEVAVREIRVGESWYPKTNSYGHWRRILSVVSDQRSRVFFFVARLHPHPPVQC